MPTLLSLPRFSGSVGRSSRGIVVFSHKEVFALRKGSASKPEKFTEVVAKLDSLQSSRFAFGVHLGFRLASRGRPLGLRKRNSSAARAVLDSRWEFVMSHPGLIVTPRKDRRQVKLVSANFIPQSFGSNARPLQTRTVDLTTIATCAPYKRWPDYFRVVEEILTRRPDFRIVALAVSQSQAEIEGIKALASNALAYPTFSLQTVLSAPGSKGLPEADIKQLLADTRAFVLFSRTEGASKVLAEASMSGCMVWATRELYFSTLRHLYSRHIGIMTPNFRRTALMLIHAVSRLDSYRPDMDAISGEFGEQASLVKLADSLSKILQQEVVIDYPHNLRFRLPNHTLDQVFWQTGADRGLATGDLIEADDFHSFFRYLENIPSAPAEG